MLRKILDNGGLEQCTGDEGCYVGKASDIILGTHVDDILGIAPSEVDFSHFEGLMEQHVELEKRGRPTKMLGMELYWETESVKLS